jgi:tRNA(Arg) A34 adenosine deaminase TadA
MNREMVAQVQKQSSALSSGHVLQRKCDRCREKGKILQRSAISSSPETVPPIVHKVLRSLGEPLDATTRAFTESRFAHDFSQIPAYSKSQASIQTKLKVNTPGDIYEQEADRIADQVLATPAHHAVSGTPPSIQRFSGQPAGLLNAAPASVDQALASPGRPLEPGFRQDMEQRFGHDFSRVRVHSGTDAERAARDVNASAYTVGHDIVFGAGRFAPGTQEGRRLIAHELAHTVQQAHGAPLAIARDPQGPPFAVNQQDIVHLRNTMLRFYNLLTPAERASLHRNTTVVIALVTHENTPTLVYTVASNSTNPGIRAAAEQLGLTRWDPEGIDKIAGERHAEQLTLEAASKTGFKVHAMAVTREPCPDCGPVVAEKGIPIEWVRDPNPVSRPPGTSGRPPGGGTPPPTAPIGRPPEPAKTETQPAGTKTVTAERGAPLEPVVEATPGFRPERGAGIGGAFQILQAMQFANLQQAEIAKFQKRYAELQPKIDAYLGKGYSVELLLIVEKPDRPDVFCAAGVFCDQSQFVYFRDLYINYVETVKPVISPSPPTSYPTIGPAGGRSGHIPYTHEGGSIIDEKEIRFLRARHADHHCEYAKQTLYPQEYAFPISPVVPRHQPAQPEKPKPRLDPAARKALAAAPARVYVESENVIQYKTAYEVIKALAGNPLFGDVKEDMGGGLGRTRTIISYRSDLDKAKAEALAEIVRSKGVPTASAELSGSGDDDPGVLTIWFGRDAEK